MKNVFILFAALDASESLEQVFAWLELGNYQHLSERDWNNLQSLIDRCAMLGFEDEMRAAQIMSHNPFRKETP
jgi:hypothetical protein